MKNTDLSNISILFIRYLYSKSKVSADDLAKHMKRKGETVHADGGSSDDPDLVAEAIACVITWFSSTGVIVPASKDGDKWKFAPGKRKVWTADLGYQNGWQNYRHLART